MTKYFIDPINGSDENDGRSYEAAWKTIAHLNKHDFEAGTTFVLAPETHLSGLDLTSSGKPGAPIVFRALREEDKQVLPGQSIIERILILLLVAIIVIAIVVVLSSQVSELYVWAKEALG